MGVFLPIMPKKWGFYRNFIPVMGKNLPIRGVFLGFILVYGGGLGVFTVVFLSFWALLQQKPHQRQGLFSKSRQR